MNHISTAAALIAAIRATDGVTGVSPHKGWIAVSVATASRAGGLAESIREAGFDVRSKDRAIVFR